MVDPPCSCRLMATENLRPTERRIEVPDGLFDFRYRQADRVDPVRGWDGGGVAGTRLIRAHDHDRVPAAAWNTRSGFEVMPGFSAGSVPGSITTASTWVGIIASSEFQLLSITEAALTGVAAADATRTRLVQASTVLPAAAKGDPWKAWLSTDTGSPSTTFVQATVPHRLADVSTIVADNWTELTDGILAAPINKDANGMTITVGTTVWTGTNQDDTSEGNNCTGWVTDSASQSGRAGLAMQVSLNWTSATDIQCDLSPLRLYCVQQGLANVPVNLKAFTIE